MARTEFNNYMQEVTAAIAGRELDAALGDFLNEKYPAGGSFYEAVFDACKQGIEEGWLCDKDHDGVAFSRPLKPSDDTQGFSVDVVRMDDLRGPHHIHAKGEIGLVMPLRDAPQFDGFDFGAGNGGWYVYPAGSAHFPTIRGGEALVLYLLPDGAIEFTGKTAD